MTDNIDGKVIIITGASSGLGEAAARRLSSSGAKLVLGARRIDRLTALVKEFPAGTATPFQVDVTDRIQMKALIDHAVTTFGRVDVMINNAGLMPLAPLEAGRVEEWDQMVDVNIKGVLYGVAEALEVFKAQSSGHFINVSSVAGHKVTMGGAVYCATKHAVRAISEGIRQELKAFNIRSTIISPGAVMSELPSSIRDEATAGAIGAFYDDVAIPADSFARCVAFAISQPADVDINEILFRPTAQEL